METGKARILIVDDHTETLSTYRLILATAGYDVTTADTGVEGLTLLQSKPFDLLLTDLRMPGLGGLELLAEARVCAPRLPVVMFTNWHSSAVEYAARRLGAVDFLEKSWDQEGFVHTIAQHLKASSDAVERRADLDTAGPATHRWVSVVAAVTRASEDVPTLTDWADELGKSVTTLKRWCGSCGVHAADSLDFARALRLVFQHSGRRVDWYDRLAIVDGKTMASFLDRAGFSAKEQMVPDLRRFLSKQTFVTNATLLAAIERALSA
jgi:CheY-like chemotaxis protein